MSLIILHHCHSVIPTGQISQRGENHNAILWFLELFGIVGWVVASSLSCLVIWMQTQNFSDSSDKSVLSVCMFLANITQLWPFKMAVWGGDIWSTNVIFHVGLNSEENKIQLLQRHNKQSTQAQSILKFKRKKACAIFSSKYNCEQCDRMQDHKELKIKKVMQVLKRQNNEEKLFFFWCAVWESACLAEKSCRKLSRTQGCSGKTIC